MSQTILIASVNYNGEIATVLFKPDNENIVINLGNVVLPYLFNASLLSPPREIYGTYTILILGNDGNCRTNCPNILQVPRPTPTPTPTVTTTRTQTPTITPTITPTPTFDPCKVPTPTPTVTTTPTKTPTNTPTPSATCTNPCGCPEPSKTPRPTKTPRLTPSTTSGYCYPTQTPTKTPTKTPTPTVTSTDPPPSVTPTKTKTPTPTVTSTDPPPSVTPTVTPTKTVTPTVTNIPIVTPTKTPTPTLTNDPQPIVAACLPLIMTRLDTSTPASVGLYSYNPTSNITTLLNLPNSLNMLGHGMANTSTKLWISNDTVIGGVVTAGGVREWDITLNPWTAVWSRDIASPSSVSAALGWLGYGLCVYRDPITNIVNPNLLVCMGFTSTFGQYNIVLVDISGSVWSKTQLFNLSTLSTNRQIRDVIMNNTGKMITIGFDTITTQKYVTQFHYVGGSWQVQLDIPITMSTVIESFFVWNNIFYIGGFPTGDLYTISNVSPYTTSFLGTFLQNRSYDSGQSPECIDLEFIPPLVCNTSVVPPTTINGITITESFAGSVVIGTGTWSSCGGGVTSPINSKLVGNTGSFSYTMNFSSPVNNIIIFITGAGFGSESFTFTTNSGSGIPTIASTLNCYTTIVGNTIISGLGADSGGGGGKFLIQNSVSFTSLTITGPGGASGSLLSICSDSF